MKPSNTDTQEIERAISAEQASDLAALQAAAQGGDVPPADVATTTPPRDLAAEVSGLVGLAVATLGPLFPSLRTIYTPQVTDAAAASIAALCHKHGWCQDGVMGRWGEEIACLAVIAQLSWQTVQGIKADIKARQPAPAEAPPALDLSAPVPATPAGSKTVTFG